MIHSGCAHSQVKADEKFVQYSEACPVNKNTGQAGLVAGRRIAQIPLIFNFLGHRQTGQGKTYPDSIGTATCELLPDNSSRGTDRFETQLRMAVCSGLPTEFRLAVSCLVRALNRISQ